MWCNNSDLHSTIGSKSKKQTRIPGTLHQSLGFVCYHLMVVRFRCLHHDFANVIREFHRIGNRQAFDQQRLIIEQIRVQL